MPDETDSPRIIDPKGKPPKHIDAFLQWQVDGETLSVDRQYALGSDE